MSESVHGGVAAARALKALEISHLFTLTGGHIFPILDGCLEEGIPIVDTRHEQTAAFAAEATARLTRRVAAAAVTAGPGVTNVMSPLAQARFNGAPLLCLAGRAPQYRWGQGSLQEIDHLPFVSPLSAARTVYSTEEIASSIVDAAVAATVPPRGPAFLDFPIEVLFNMTDGAVPVPSEGGSPGVPGDHEVSEIARLIDAAQRPMIVAGSNVWLDRAEHELVAFAETIGAAVFMSGQGRGCLPADHRLAFSRTRSQAFKEADLILVMGTPFDFRLGFGQGFASGAQIVHLDSADELLAEHVDLAASLGAPLASALEALSTLVTRRGSSPWLESLRQAESSKVDRVQEELRSTARPIHPMRIYGELVPLLDRNAVVVGDGGDFVSYAGREIPSSGPGRWLDPGPYGCLGVGPGYSMAARLTYPDAQVVALFGDGAIGFSGMELESLVRLGLPVVCVVGNNGIWGLEKHPMQALYGRDVAADLRPGIRYDLVMEAFGGRGFFVEDPEDLAPALKKALDCGEPALVNVVTDASVAYPRSSNLM